MLFKCSPCCQCQVCKHSTHDCLTLTLDGFVGDPQGQGCDECDHLDGTYILRRGVGAEVTLTPYIRATGHPAGKGSGATVTATLSKDPETEEHSIASVTLTASGSGYVDGAYFDYTAEGLAVACDKEPQVDVVVGRTPPVLTAGADYGTGAEFSIVVAPVNESEGAETWGIDKVTIKSGGSGYHGNSGKNSCVALAISHSEKTTQLVPASVTACVERLMPQVSAYIETDTGFGGQVSLQWEQTHVPPSSTDYESTWWELTGIVIESEGIGHQVGDKIAIQASAETFSLGEDSPGLIYYGSEVAAVGANGEIVSVNQGAYGLLLYRTTGAIGHVKVNEPGEYFIQDGVQSVTLVDGGSFYPSPSCKYTWEGCQTCVPISSPHERLPMEITFEAGADEHSLVAKIAGSTIIHATTPADDGAWTKLTFAKSTFYPGVKAIEVVAGGSGYTLPPTVTITGDGEGAEATATVRGYVDSLTLTSQGNDFYETPPTVTLTGGGGTGATATASTGFGGLKIFLGSGGEGYTSPPTVTISGGGGSGATAVATVRQAVDSITVTKAGSGYTAPPTVTLSGGGGGSGAVAVATLKRDPVGCDTSGTATLEPVTCTEPTKIDKCDMPKQISLSLAGMGEMLIWGTNAGGPLPFEGPLTEECGLNPDGTVVRLFSQATAGNQTTIWVAGILENVSGVILDLTAEECGSYTYTGLLPASARGLNPNAFNPETWDYKCGGDLSHEVAVNINPISIDSAITISPPTKAPGQTATADVTAVGGNGEVTGVAVLDPGFGYAAEIVERVEPEVVAGVDTVAGTGAALSVTLSQVGTGDDAYWVVESVEVDNGGTDYAPGELIAFSTADEIYSGAFAYIQVPTEEPTLSASVDGGSGAVLTLTLTEQTDYYGNAMWAVDAVAVSSGGTGYTDGSPVVFTVDDGVMRAEASATVTVGREQPDVLVGVASALGTGAVLSAVLTESNNSWYVASVTVTDGGTGYDPGSGDYIVFSTDDEEVYAAFAVFDVDGNGTITGVTMYSGGTYFRSTGVIESVAVSSGGEYYKSDGTIAAVVVTDGGQYWRLQGTGQADVDVPDVNIFCESGSGATATATVDSQIGSPTFGQITGLTITNGGEGYVLDGSGWKLTVSLMAFSAPSSALVYYFSHLDGEPQPAGFGDWGQYDCDNFSGRYTPLANRVVAGICPTALVSRAYAMSLPIAHDSWATNAFGNVGNAVYCVTPFSQYGIVETFYELGSGPFTITLAPA